MPYSNWRYAQQCYAETCGSPGPGPLPEVATGAGLAARYYVLLRDPLGNQVAIFDHWKVLRFSHQLNDQGSLVFCIDGHDPRVPLFELDGQIEVWRSVPGAGLDWYLEFESVIRDTVRQTLANGAKHFTALAFGPNSFLARRIISYFASSPFASKSAPAETVMKEFVDENLGPGATAPPRPWIPGVMPGFSVQADSGWGGVWTGDRAFRNLLEVLQEIANFSGLDFNVVGIGPGAWEFRTYPGQLGQDRTTNGLDAATGLNAAGNAPVVFSLEYGNMTEPTYSLARSGERTAAYVLGSGQDLDRPVGIAVAPAAMADSPYNLLETSRGGASQNTPAQLGDQAVAELEKLQAQEKFSFKPLQIPSTLYGLHYWWGDRITASYDGLVFHKKLVTVNVDMSNPDERITMEFADLP